MSNLFALMRTQPTSSLPPHVQATGTAYTARYTLLGAEVGIYYCSTMPEGVLLCSNVPPPLTAIVRWWGERGLVYYLALQLGVG